MLIYKLQHRPETNIYPMIAAVRKVTAGTRLDMALAIEDEAKYNPSKYIV